MSNYNVDTLENKIIVEAQEALEQLEQIIGSVNKAKESLESIKHTTGLKYIDKEAKKATSSLAKVQTISQKIKKALNFSGIIYGAKRAYDLMQGSTKNSIDYVETLNLFEVSMGKTLDAYGNVDSAASKYYTKALNFQNRLNEAFGTNIEETMRYQALYNQMTKSMGVGNNASYIISENLTKLGIDLASLFNKSESATMEALRAGVLAGQTKPLRNYGLDVTQNSLAPLLSSLGINRSMNDLSQAEKMILRYIAVLKQASAAHGDFAKTIESPSNQLKVLKSQFEELKTAIGNLFQGLLGQVLPYINAIIMVVKELVKLIGSLFGFKVTSSNSNLAETVGIDDLSDGLSSAVGSAKALKAQLMGFDEINNITTETSSSGGGGSFSPTGIDQRLLDALGEYDNLMDNVRMKAIDIRDKIMEWLGFTQEIDPATGEINWKLKDGYQKIEKIRDLLKTIGLVLAGYKISSGVISFLDTLGLVKNSQTALRVATGIVIEITGITLMYQGIKKIINGEFDAESIIETAGGTGIVLAGAALQFKKVALLKIGILATFDIAVSLSIAKWWNQYYDDMKKELYSNKKNLNLGEFLNVSFSAIGEGAWNFLDSIFGDNFRKGIEDYFKKHDFGRFLLGEVLNSLTLGLMSDEIKQTPQNIGEKIISGISTGAENAMQNTLLGPAGPIIKGVGGIGSIFSNWEENFDTMQTWYSDKVAPWFTKEKWTGLAEDSKKSVEEKFETFKNNFKSIGDWYNEKVVPWFSKEKWGNNANDAKTGTESKFNEFKEQFKPIEEWYNKNISPWFTKEKWEGIGGNAKTWLEEKFNEFKINFHPISDWWNNHIAPWFTKEKWQQLGRDAVSGIKDTLNLNNVKFKMPHISWESRETQASGTVKKVLEFLNLPTSLPKLNVSWYASGGMPEMGELFMAREAGPELVGRIGRRTAVANNGQIVEAVSKGVYDAVSAAMPGGSTVSLDIRADEGIIVKKAANGFKEFVMQTGELPFPVPV